MLPVTTKLAIESRYGDGLKMEKLRDHDVEAAAASPSPPSPSGPSRMSWERYDEKESWDKFNEDEKYGEDEEAEGVYESDYLQPNLDEPPTPRKSDRRSTAFLDGLRGLAAFMVYMCHHFPWWYGMDSNLENGFGYSGQHYLAQLPFLRSIWTGGNAAVATFFVLSGYVLSVAPLRLLRAGKTTALRRGLLSAFVRRPLRLFIPPMGVSLTFALFMQLPFGLAPHLQWPKAEANVFAELRTWVGEIVWMMDPFSPHGVFTRWFRYDPPAWTMAVEFRGSVMVFALIALVSFAPQRFHIGILGAVGILLFATYYWSMACFMGGMVLAMNDLEGYDRAFLDRRLSKRGKTIMYNVIFWLAWWILCEPGGKKQPEMSYDSPGWYYMTMIIPRNYYDGEFWRFWNVVGAVLLVYAVLNVKWLQTFFNTRTLQYLGRISFSLYLIHIPLEWTIGDRICRLLGVVRQDFTMWYDGKLAVPDIGPVGFSSGFIISQLFIMPITFILSEVSTRLLDGPSVKAGRWLVARLGLEESRARSRA